MVVATPKQRHPCGLRIIHIIVDEANFPRHLLPAIIPYLPLPLSRPDRRRRSYTMAAVSRVRPPVATKGSDTGEEEGEEEAGV